MGWTLALAAAGLVTGCERAEKREFPTEDRITAGIFLEPTERAALPAGVALRPVYQKGIDLTKRSEGFLSHLYNDAAGYCTIAYGHLVKLARCNGTEPTEFLRGVSEPRGEELLVGDMTQAQIVVQTAVGNDLNHGQFAALCDFVYNVGGGNFRSSTLLRVVNAGQPDQVPYQFRRWVKAGGRTLPGLEERREREIDLYFEGLPKPRAAPSADVDLTPIDIRTGEAPG
jgi:GH24 family phage-related lysozyme (muramidase)